MECRLKATACAQITCHDPISNYHYGAQNGISLPTYKLRSVPVSAALAVSIPSHPHLARRSRMSHECLPSGHVQLFTIRAAQHNYQANGPCKTAHTGSSSITSRNNSNRSHLSHSPETCLLTVNRISGAQQSRISRKYIT
jgi:hypothetical protein